MFRPLRLVGLAFAFLVLGLAPAYAAPFVVLDTFDLPAGGQSALTGSSVPGSLPSTTGVGFLGATRTVSWTGTGGGPGGTLALGEAIAVNDALSPGDLFFSTVTSSIELELKYSSFGTADLSGYTGVELDFSLLDPASIPFDIFLDLATTSGSLTGLITVGTPGPQVVFFPFSALTGPGSLSNVTQIILRLNDNGSPNQSADFILRELRLPLVPEPGSLVLLGLGSLGVVGLALRRRKG